MKIIGHIPDALAKLVHGVMSEWKILQMIDKIDEKHKIAPEGTCMPGGGIGIVCIYILYGAKNYKTNLWEKIKWLILKSTSIYFSQSNPY